MDLERIKQNLRLRSGRTKKSGKKVSTAVKANTDPSTISNTHQPSIAVQPKERISSQSPAKPVTSRSDSKPQAAGGGQEKGIDQTRSQSQIKQPAVATQSSVSSTLSDRDRPKPGSQDIMAGRENSNGIRSRNGLALRDSTAKVSSNAMKDPDTLEADLSEAEDFDLRPPAPRPKPPSMESMSELLFSPGHLNTMIHSTALLTQFTTFLRRYRPDEYHILLRYLETSKAIRAIEYANAVAESAPALPQKVVGNKTETSNIAAVLDDSFDQACSSAFGTLVDTSLPLYITYNLIRTVSGCLIDEITGRTASHVRGMVVGLSEVFCLTDPSQKDNPIIYASEEFYRLSGYGPDDVIGHNCRFLQGSKTNHASTKRIRQSLDRGEENYETLLNYRRDGRPFVNLLMIAPLHDDKGNVKYNIGAQIDVSRLIEGGFVLEGFQKYLLKREAEKMHGEKSNVKKGDEQSLKRRKALDKLKELSELFDLEESAIVQASSRPSSRERDDESVSVTNWSTRRRLAASDVSDDEGASNDAQEKWKLGQTGPQGLSGKLPGVYEKYMLIRPAPSLRIIFISPKVHKFGAALRSPFLSHVAAPPGTLSGLSESFEAGIPVSAKINFMPKRSGQRNGTNISPNERHEDGKHGLACWMSATPLLGADNQVGVWIIILVEKAQAMAQRVRTRPSPAVRKENLGNGTSNRKQRQERSSEQQVPGPPGTNHNQGKGRDSDGTPIKPKRLEDAFYSITQQEPTQQSFAMYQDQASAPVEQYRSADEAEALSSPTLSLSKAQVLPQISGDELDCVDEFVHSTSNQPSRRSPHRIRTSSESEQDRGRASSGLSGMRPRKTSDLQGKSRPQNPNDIPPSEPSDNEQVTDDEVVSFDATTLVRSPTPEKQQDFDKQSIESVHRPSSARSKSSSTGLGLESQPTPRRTKGYRSHTARSSTTLPAGLGYLDHLRYGGAGRKSPGETKRGRRVSRGGSENDPDVTDGCKSPSSVD